MSIFKSMIMSLFMSIFMSLIVQSPIFLSQLSFFKVTQAGKKFHFKVGRKKMLPVNCIGVFVSISKAKLMHECTNAVTSRLEN